MFSFVDNITEDMPRHLVVSFAFALGAGHPSFDLL